MATIAITIAPLPGAQASQDRIVPDLAEVATVFTSDDITTLGVRSVAELLEHVPGFYDVYSLAEHSMSVRGLFPGPRTPSNALVVLINDTPVHFLPTRGPSLGEELVPLDLVERVEVSRGGASTRYGPHALSAVVRIVTRIRGGEDALLVSAHGNAIGGNPGGGGGAAFVLNDAEGGISAELGAHLSRHDRSGTFMGSTAALRDVPSFSDQAAEASRDDVTKPLSLYAQGGGGDARSWGRLTATASVQRLDSRAEFADYVPLTHQTRFHTLHQTYGLRYHLQPSDDVTVDATVRYLSTAPQPGDRIVTAASTFALLRSYESMAIHADSEVSWRAHQSLSAVLAAGFTNERHRHIRFERLSLTETPDGPPGTLVPRDDGVRGPAQSDWTGVWGSARAVWQATPSLTISGGGRVDHHNIWGLVWSGRLDATFAWNNELSVAAIADRSFRAVVPHHYSATTYTPFDYRGFAGPGIHAVNQLQLRASWQTDRARVSAAGYGNLGTGRLIFIDTSNAFLDGIQLTRDIEAGAELEGHVDLFGRLRVAGWVAMAMRLEQVLPASADPQQEVPLMPRVPSLLARVTLRWQPFGNLPLYLTPSMQFVGERESSYSNSTTNGVYRVPGFAESDVTLSLVQQGLFASGPTDISLRAAGLVMGTPIEMGGRSVDHEMRAPSVWLHVRQAL